jgi:predicted amidophosphoribosyltransferase
MNIRMCIACKHRTMFFAKYCPTCGTKLKTIFGEINVKIFPDSDPESPDIEAWMVLFLLAIACIWVIIAIMAVFNDYKYR